MINHPQKQRSPFANLLLPLLLAVFLTVAFAAKAEENHSFISPSGVSMPRDTTNASFPGGERERANYLTLAINADEHYKDSIHRAQGTISIRFTVDETGSLKDFAATDNDIPYLTNLIVKSLKEGPVWKPKMVEGSPVSSIAQLSLKVSANKWGVMKFEY